MILSKDSNTLNLTTSILSAKSMLQTKLDEIGIDIQVIERNIEDLRNEMEELKKEVEETKDELKETAEDLKNTTDNQRIIDLIDQVEEDINSVEIPDDIFDDLCLSGWSVTCNQCYVNEHSPDSGVTCYECHEQYFGDDLPEICIAYDSIIVCPQEYCTLAFTYGEGSCSNGYDINRNPDLDCWQDYDEQEGIQDSQCLKGYKTTTVQCVKVYVVKVDGTALCSGGYIDTFSGDSCIKIYNVTKKGVSCDGYESTEYGRVSCEENHTALYDDQGFVDSIECPRSYTDEENNTSCESDFFEKDGIVSCSGSHTGDDGTCIGEHTWGDGIGGQCKGVFNNSQMNCQGGVATNEAEQQLLCNGDYTSGNINCAGGFAEDVDDHETFCPSNFSDGHTTCRQMYMKQNGVETCSNKDPISCRGGCVSGYCDYCGGCVGSCDSCRSCHGAGNCSYNTCPECYHVTYSTTCGAPSCGGTYNNCASNGWHITCTGDF